MTRSRSRSRARLRAAGLGGLAAFVGLVVLQHATRADDLPPADHFVSEYAVGPGGWVQVIAFLAWAVSLAAAVAIVRATGERRVARAVTVAGLSAGTAGAFLTACFATITVGGQLPAGRSYTTAGHLHDYGSAAIFFGLLLAAAAGVRLLPRRRFRLEVLGLAVLLFLIPAALVAAGYDAPGWGQRGFIAVGCLWEWRLLVAASGEPQRTRGGRA